MAPPPALELRGIDKRFGTVHANRGVTMSIEKGSITGIVGENGAGKSTLMSIVYGLYEADAGEILVDGKSARIRAPADAMVLGIGMVHQHFLLIDSFTVLENVVLGAEGGPLLRQGLAAARRELQRLASEFGLGVDPDALVGSLSVGEQQRVEILKVLFRGARILILDEPSAVLTPQETERLFRILRTLNLDGVTVVLITHKLREVMAATEAVHVMRQGEVVAHRRTSQTTPQELAELMVGRKVRLEPERGGARAGEELLRAEGLTVIDARGVRMLDAVDLTLHAGEILGVAGVSGNGQSELLQVLAGIRAPNGGRMLIAGRPVDPAHPVTPSQLRALGVAHIPEDRLRQGLVRQFSATESSILGYHEATPFARHGILDRQAAAGHCAGLVERFDVRPANTRLACGNFSGGNQQKLVVGRELSRAPRILLIGQPTRGVDIGAIELIHREIIAWRDAGCAILIVSVELEEIMSLADRIVVMSAGRIVGEVAAEATDERGLGLMMTNSAPTMAAS